MDFMQTAYAQSGNSSYLQTNSVSQSRNMANSQQHQTSFEVWNLFFHSAGIPSSVSHDYAMKFSQHRVRIDMLQEISKDILLDMGIKAMGDIIAILRHAKSICTQNELKPSGIVKTVSQASHLGAPQAPINASSSIQSLTQRMPITTNQTALRLAPASTGPSVGNKIQSRLNLRSGAVIASSNNNGYVDGQRVGSSLSSSLAKRLAPAPNERKLNLDLTEKTLTVHYPSRAAIAKAAQRISGPDSHANNHQRANQASSSIKSRLGAVRPGSTGKYESSSGNNVKLNNNPHITKQAHRNNSNSKPTNIRDLGAPTRRHETRQSNDRSTRNANSSDKHPNTRLKSTVFSRLGQPAR